MTVLDSVHPLPTLLTRQRLVTALRDQGPDARVVDIMLPATQIPVVAPSVDLAQVWEVMAQSGGRVVAVQDGPDFLGVITSDDIAEVFQIVDATLDNEQRHPPPPSTVMPQGPQTDG